MMNGRRGWPPPLCCCCALLLPGPGGPPPAAAAAAAAREASSDAYVRTISYLSYRTVGTNAPKLPVTWNCGRRTVEIEIEKPQAKKDTTGFAGSNGRCSTT